MTSNVAGSHPPELLSGPCGCPRNHELPTPKSKKICGRGQPVGEKRRLQPGDQRRANRRNAASVRAHRGGWARWTAVRCGSAHGRNWAPPAREGGKNERI